jgi:hypothetical protein
VFAMQKLFHQIFIVNAAIAGLVLVIDLAHDYGKVGITLRR